MCRQLVTSSPSPPPPPDDDDARRALELLARLPDGPAAAGFVGSDGADDVAKECTHFW